MQSIAGKAKTYEAYKRADDVSAGEAIVLPRLLRRPVRRTLRFVTGGMRATKSGIIVCLLCALLAIVVLIFSLSSSADHWKTQLAVMLGIVVDHYEISGNYEVSDADIVAMVAAEHGSTIFTYDVSATRDQLNRHPWISQAVVSRIYPNTVSIDVKEHPALAVWQTDDGLSLIRPDGTKLAAYDDDARGLPLVVGVGANAQAAKMLTLMQKFPSVSVRTRALVRIGERRWDVAMNSGTIIMLPELGVREELERLSKLIDNEDLLSRDIVQVDMRMSDRLVLRMSHSAGEIVKSKRANQIKRLKKAKKGRNT